MKKYFALLISFLMIFGAVPSFADEVAAEPEYIVKYEDQVEYDSYIVVNNEIVANIYTGAELYWSEDYPLAPVMRALGYEVLYDSETKIISCIKPDISYCFDIDKCLVWSLHDGEMNDIVLYSNPYIADGVTYVTSYFFRFILQEPGLYVYNYNNTGNPAYVFYDLSVEIARINAAFKSYMDKIKSLGIKPQEYGMKMKGDFKLTCEDLGLVINSGMVAEAKCYVDLDNKFISCNMEYDFSGLYNALKLMLYGTINTDNKFSMQTVIDGENTYTKNNLDIYSQNTGWISGTLPDGFNFQFTEEMLGEIIEAFSGADASNINNYADALADCFEALINSVKITREGNTVTITSTLDESFVKSIIDMVVYSISEEGTAGENSELMKSVLEGTKFTVDSSTVIKDGIYTEAESTGGGTICVTIPNTGISFKIEFNTDTSLCDSELPVYHNSSEINDIK